MRMRGPVMFGCEAENQRGDDACCRLFFLRSQHRTPGEPTGVRALQCFAGSDCMGRTRMERYFPRIAVL